MSPYPVITELVPHARPMLAVDELLDWRPGRVEVRLKIDPEDLFVVDGEVDGVVTLEYMAQGVAACLGYEAFRAGQAVRVGMVIACRSLTVERSPLLVGEEFVITAEQVRGSEWLSHFDTSMVDAAGEPVAQAMLTLVHTDAPGV